MAKGSVRQKPGRKIWYYRFYIEDETGRRRQIERPGTESKAETERMLRQAMEEYEKKRFVAKNNNLTLLDAMDLWIEEVLKPGHFSNGTVQQYIIRVNKIKRHPLAQRKLKSITADHIQTYVNFLSCGGTGPDGERCEPLEVGTVKSYLNLLNKVFSFAIFPKRLLAVNPVEHVTIRPKPKNSDIFQTEDSSESHVLSPEQYRVLTDYLKKQRNPALLPVQISYYTGLRLGEACGLTWKDINLDEQFLTVKRSIGYSSARKATTVGPTKNKKPRTVDFGDNLADILRKAKAQQARESLKYGPLYKVNYYQKTADLKRTFNDLYTLNRNEIPPDGYVAVNFVCVRHDGEYQRPSTITSLFQSISKTLPGMGNIHFHQLRHTYASNLVKSGAAPKDVQELLGHANISTTMNIYAHAERDSKRATARLLDKLASGE